MQVEFTVPVYNEEKILKKNLIQLYDYLKHQNFNFDWKIVAIINGSRDNSVAILKELQNEKNNEITFVNYPKPGKGQALKRYWKESLAEILIFMDIDLAVSLNNINKLVQPINKDLADLVVGSRLMAASNTKRTYIREISSRCYNYLSRIILRHNFSDLQCGFKAIKKSVFMAIEPQITNQRWFYDTELIVFAHYYKYRIQEIPVDWSENRYDTRKSKVNLLKDSLSFLINLVNLKIRLMNHLGASPRGIQKKKLLS